MTFAQYIPFYRRNLRIALPAMLTQAGGAVVQLVDTLMVGQVGTKELAAVSFSTSVSTVLLMFLIGIATAITPLVGHNYVIGQTEEVRRIYHNSGFLLFILTNIAALLSLSLIPLFGYMGQDPDVIRLAEPYYKLIVASWFPFLGFYLFKQMGEGLGNTKVAMVITLIANALNILLNYMLIYGEWGAPRLGVAGAGWATLASRCLQMILFMTYFYRHKEWRPLIGGSPLRYLHKQTLRKILRMGSNIGTHFCLEFTAFGFSAIMVGWFSAAALAAYQIVWNLCHLSFMVYLGVQSAATIEVSHFFGERRYNDILKTGKAAYHIGICIITLIFLIFLLGRHLLPTIFTDDKEVIRIAGLMIIPMSIMQFSDGLQAIGSGLLRGITDVKRPMQVAFFAYIVINLPIGYFVSFTLGVGPAGIWIGFLAGLSIAAITFYRRFRSRIEELHNHNELSHLKH